MTILTNIHAGEFNFDGPEETPRCPTCGHLLVEYSFNFNKGLASVLIKLYEAGGPIEIAKLHLTNSQYSNYPKLAYWDVAAKHTIDEDTKGGVWKITQRGIDFIAGHLSMRRKVVMKNGEFIRFDGDSMMFNEIVAGYDYKPYYRDQVREQFGEGG